MKVIKYRTGEGTRHGLLVKEGRTKLHLMLMDNPIKITKVSISEARYMEDMDYPVAKCRRKLKKAAITYHGSIRNLSREAREVLS